MSDSAVERLLVTPRRGWLTAALCAAIVLCQAGPALAQGADWKSGRLGHLAPLIGTYRHHEVLDDPLVKSSLRALAGDDVARIVANLDVAGSIDFVEGNLVLRGNAPHRGGDEETMVLVKIYDGTVRAALLHDGAMRLYAGDTEYAFLPQILREFLRPRAREPQRPSLPDDVLWRHGRAP